MLSPSTCTPCSASCATWATFSVASLLSAASAVLCMALPLRSTWSIWPPGLTWMSPWSLDLSCSSSGGSVGFPGRRSSSPLSPRPLVPAGWSGGSVSASGWHVSSSVAFPGSSDGLGVFVDLATWSGWMHYMLHALALLVIGWWVSCTVSPMLPPLAWPMHSPSSSRLWVCLVLSW